ncbi:MAG: lasso peptide isopeptide bond-forming cyclase [Rhodothermus sp.]|nr:lasso peptide isopeptide bond-forming cyclase [Rhodothermus sp.]
MSAIFGLIHFDGRPIAITSLRPALDVLAHRGPDGQGRWQEGPVLLAHWMLHTTPESLYEQQPLMASEGDLVLVADARIDNRDELLAALQLRSNAERPITDAELILAAYRRWGEACPDRLIGDFAFAIWDRRARRLFAARDGMGVRPFYYLHDGRRFAFATLLPAVRLLPDVPQDLEEELILRFLTRTLEQEKERTFYRSIRRLPGGHALQVDAREMRLWRYWQPDLEQELRFRTEAEYVEAFRACFEEAVRCRLRSAFPIGSQLSGGLDSSSVTSMAAWLLGKQPLHTYSAIFPELPEERRAQMDEQAYAEAVLQRYANIEPHFFRPEFESPLVALENLLAHYDQPFFSANYHFAWGFAQMARRNAVRVMLNGVDGDSVVLHGWERLTLLFQEGAWDTFAQEAELFARHLDVSPVGLVRQYAGPALTHWGRRYRWLRLGRAVWWLRQRYQLPAFELLRIHGVWPHVPAPILQRWQRWRGRRPIETPILSPRVRAWMRQNGKAQKPVFHSFRESHWQSLTRGLWQWALEFSDVLHGLQGIEERMPFFDRRLIELSVRIPLEMKFREGWPRYILRVALEGILPPEVQWRAGKSNIGFGFYQGLLCHERARIEALLQNSAPLSPFVTSDSLAMLWQQAQRPPEQNGDADFLLYLLLILEAWLKRWSSAGAKVE